MAEQQSVPRSLRDSWNAVLKYTTPCLGFLLPEMGAEHWERWLLSMCLQMPCDPDRAPFWAPRPLSPLQHGLAQGKAVRVEQQAVQSSHRGAGGAQASLGSHGTSVPSHGDMCVSLFSPMSHVTSTLHPHWPHYAVRIQRPALTYPPPPPQQTLLTYLYQSEDPQSCPFEPHPRQTKISWEHRHRGQREAAVQGKGPGGAQRQAGAEERHAITHGAVRECSHHLITFQSGLPHAAHQPLQGKGQRPHKSGAAIPLSCWTLNWIPAQESGFSWARV